MKQVTIKTLIFVLCVTLCFVFLLSACNNDSPASTPTPTPTPTPDAPPVVTPDPEPAEVKMTDGYYLYNGPRTGDMDSFFKFYEDGSYYGKFFDGGVIEAGLFEVIDKNMDYIADFGPDEEPETDDDVIATANQVVVLTNYATGGKQEIAFNFDYLLDATLGGMAGHVTLGHKPDYDYDPEVLEIAIAVQTFYYQYDTGSSLTLYHNRTFNDYTTAGENGTWEMIAGGYSLETSDGNTYTLTVSENGNMATYVKGNETLELTSTTSEGLYTFTAVTMPEGLPMDVDIALICKPDGTANVVISHTMMGDIIVDTGTWSVEHMVFITFEFEKGGGIAGEPDLDNASEVGVPVIVPYKANVSLEDYGMDLGIDCELTGAITP